MLPALAGQRLQARALSVTKRFSRAGARSKVDQVPFLRRLRILGAEDVGGLDVVVDKAGSVQLLEDVDLEQHGERVSLRRSSVYKELFDILSSVSDTF